MILCAKNFICLALVVVSASACGMMRDDATTASNQKQDWFEYAYYSSAALNEQEGGSTAVVKPLRLQ